MNPVILEFIPIIAFFVTYKLYGIYYATLVCAITIILQTAYNYYQYSTINKGQLITLITILIFGGATLWLKNPLFIKWKPTIIYWLFALIIFYSSYINKKPILKKLMQDHISLKLNHWLSVTNFTGWFFILMGGLNLLIAYKYSTDIWVNFKLFGTLSLTIIFILAISFYIKKLNPNALEGA